jgi:hypothetical protein
MRFLIIVFLLVSSCSDKKESSMSNVRIKTLDSLFLQTYQREPNAYYDSINLSNSMINVKINTNYTYIYDTILGVREIHERVVSDEPNVTPLSDSIQNCHAYFLYGSLYKISANAYPKIKEGTDYPFGKALYYLSGDSIIYKLESGYSLSVKEYIDHFNYLAKKFNDSLKIKK